ncbi:MAG: phage tail tip lysozyme [Oliverpabstia sp.]|nr:phage tail tip lysozyme [Oliverpabstia sp.]
MKSLKKISTQVTTTMVAAGMIFGSVPPVQAGEITSATNIGTMSEMISGEIPSANSEEILEATPQPSPEAPPEPTPEVTPKPTPEVTPEPTPEITPEPTPEATPEPTPEVTPEPTPEATPEPTPETTPEPTPEVTPQPSPQATPEPTPEQEIPSGDGTEVSQSEQENSSQSNWINHIDYSKYFIQPADYVINYRKGFGKIEKVYAYAKVDTFLNIREGTSLNARVVGKLPRKGICYVIEDGDKDWVYIESGDVRGFVKRQYLQLGKKAARYVKKTGEEKLETAEPLIRPQDNKAFDYSVKTVYDVQQSTGEGIITFADYFLEKPFQLGGTSLEKGIDASHFVYEILSRCGAYDGKVTKIEEWEKLGEEIESLEDAQAGDVICYKNHVALYDGKGKIVEAKDKKSGIIHERKADEEKIRSIRRFVVEVDEEGGSNADIIKNYLLSLGFTKAGIAGIMANIANESYPAFEASSLEFGSIHNSGISSAQYTAMVDSGAISREEVIVSSRFGLYSGGRYGYGLCGFTDPVIKEYLCHYTIDVGKSIGSITGQLDSLLAYLSVYNPNLLSRVKNADSPQAAASAFLREYERCANIEQEEVERMAAAEEIYKAIQ